MLHSVVVDDTDVLFSPLLPKDLSKLVQPLLLELLSIDHYCNGDILSSLLLILMQRKRDTLSLTGTGGAVEEERE